MPDYRNAIAAQLAQRRRSAVALPPLPPLGTSPQQMARMVPVAGTPVHRPPGTQEPNALMAGYRAAAGPADEDAAEWGAVAKALYNKWNQPVSSDDLEAYVYGDREAGPR